MPIAVTLNDVLAQGDFLQNDRFRWMLPALPFVSNTDLSVKCSRFDPGQQGITPVIVRYAGHTRAFAGHRLVEKQFHVDYFEDDSMITTQLLKGWLGYQCAWNDGSSLGSDFYSGRGVFFKFDNAGNVCDVRYYTNVFPLTIGEPEVNALGGLPYVVSTTFTYDEVFTYADAVEGILDFGITALANL